MNRKVLFRGRIYHPDPMTNSKNGWVEGFYYEELKSGRVRSYIYNYPMWWEVDPATIGQFTGLRDDMGVEIFEGDILRILNIRKSIYEQKEEYVYGSVLFQQSEYLIKTKDRIATLVGTVTDNPCEVFGNIHDNPELLKER